VDNVDLQNNYYAILMGNITSSAADVSTVVPNAPSWTRIYQNNTGTGLPDRNYWSLNMTGTTIVMVSGSKLERRCR
jgi:hypothetical protein